MPVQARKFDAIEAAKALFWEKGFTDTSMADVVAATGMNRYALYATFGNKREIFLEALASYFEEGRARFEPILYDTATAPLTRIEIALNTTAGMMQEKQSGCFMCHVAVDHCAEDAKVAEAVQSYFKQIRNITMVPLVEAAEAGDLNPHLTPEMAAQLVFDAEMSMGVHARAGADPGVFATITQVTLAALKARQV